MELTKRIEAFANLGNCLRELGEMISLGKMHPGGNTLHQDFIGAINKANKTNQWMTRENIYLAVSSIAERLTLENLLDWTNRYPELGRSTIAPKSIGVVMAGNIPLVGFHDFLCVLASGNILHAKTSSKDDQLLKIIGDMLIFVAPGFKGFLFFEEGGLKNMDAVIATGSNNTSRYFEYYFGKYPNIIRKNRHSTAILSGNETPEELQLLGRDIFSYFGLGCRNVSKIYLPWGYDVHLLQGAFDNYRHIIRHPKYANNYNYNKTILHMNRIPYVDGGFYLLKEDKGLSSPVSVIFYEYYANLLSLEKQLEKEKENIQCIVSKTSPVGYGDSQRPQLWDYADNVDTIEFIMRLSNNNRL